ncbi:RDD family protein [Candidatus Bathyarchaeota archaeon]|nr:RDD family protein [Candidatus Bathyarchaeota archaeon]
MPYCEKCGAKIPEDAVFCPNCGAPVRAYWRRRLETAGWGERFVAWMIDIIVVGVLLALFKWYFLWLGFVWFKIIDFSKAFIFMRGIPFIDVGFDNIVYFLYWTFTEGICGQSIGKIVMKMKVTRLDGGKISMMQAAVESIGKAFLLPIDCLIGWLLYSKKQQRLFNYISETIVIKVSY